MKIFSALDQFESRIDITTKAQHRGLCPTSNQARVLMEKSLVDEVAILGNSTPTNGVFWLERLDAFIDQAREQLSNAPSGCRSFSFNVWSLPTANATAAFTQSLYVPVQAEIEYDDGTSSLVFSSVGRQSAAA